MTTHSESRVMPYSAQQMYDLIAKIEDYPEFLPWCAAVRKRSSKMVDGCETVDATNNWHFEPVDEGSCTVNFFVDFEFKSRTLQALIGVVFHQAMQQVVRAFEKRAAALYGAQT